MTGPTTTTGDTKSAEGPERPSGTSGGIQWRARTALVLETIGAVSTVAAVILLIEICREQLAADPDHSRLWRLVLSAVAAVVGGLAAQLAGRTLSRGAASRTQELLSAGVAGRVHGAFASRPLHAAWRTHGTTLGRDIAATGAMVARAGSELLSTGLGFVLSIGYLFWVDWGMALVTLIPIVLGFIAFGVISARFLSEMKDDYVTNISAIDTVRPEVDLDARIHRAGARARTATSTRTSARRLTEVTDEFSGFFVTRISSLLGGRAVAEIAFSPLTVLVVVLCGGTLMIRADWLAAPDLLPFLLVGAGLAAPLLAITYALEEVGEGKKATARLMAFTLGSPPPSDPADGPESASADATPLELPDRGVVTFVGTTQEAADQVIDRITASTPVERFAAVEADPAVVLGRIDEYLTAGRADGSTAEAERAARVAGVHDMIAALPRGYASLVGTEVSLSYPELQRFALARALAADRAVILLDQRAFPGDLDVLRAAVDDLRERATVVVVTVGPPDVIEGQLVLMDAGQAAESGTHEELLRAGGRYAALWEPLPNPEPAAVAGSRSVATREISR